MFLDPSRFRALSAPARRLSRAIDSIKQTEVPYALLIVAVGAIGGVVGLLYRGALGLFQAIIFASSGTILEIAQRLPWQQRVLYPAAGALLGALVIKYRLKEAGGEGMSEIMEAVVIKEKSLRVRRALWKGLATLTAIGSGMSVGREGPMAQISAAAAGRIAEILRISTERRRMLISCGVAAGMAAAYNAPIGAAFFVMEVVIGNFAMEIFGPLVIASVVSTLVTRGVVGSSIYETPVFQLVSTWEFLFYIILGVACALVGRVFIEAIILSGRLFSHLPLPRWACATIGGLGVGTLGIWVPHVWGNGYEGVDLALQGSLPVQLLAWILAGKMVATALSIGSGTSGGVFTPTLFLGAALGGLVGTGAHALWPAVTAPAGAYALVGMSAMLAATTHAPIMSTLMVFEMSLNYNLILPVLACSGVAAMISRALKKESIYTERLKRRGVDIDLAIEETALQSIHVEDVMWTDPPTARPDTSLRTLLDQFLNMTGGGMIHVVADDGRYVGLIDVHDLLAAAEKKELGDLVIASDLARMIPHVEVGEPVSHMMEKFWFQEHGELPVLTRDTPPRFLGIVTRRDVLRAFDREVFQRKLLTVRYSPGATPNRGPRESTVALPADFIIQELPVPASLVGKTLIELDLPHRFLLTALSLHPAGEPGAEIIPPPADRKLMEGDRLVLVGRRKDLARFAHT